jgi:exportin-2 (importin alpha re-exporter)
VAAQSLLGVFQKLVSTRAHDHEGFFILNALVESLPADVVSPFLPTVSGPSIRNLGSLRKTLTSALFIPFGLISHEQLQLQFG